MQAQKTTVLNEIADSLEKLAGVCRNLIEQEQDELRPTVQLALEPTISLEQVRSVLANISRAGHTAEVRELLLKHGAAKLSDIDPAVYKALLADAEELNNAT